MGLGLVCHPASLTLLLALPAPPGLCSGSVGMLSVPWGCSQVLLLSELPGLEA